MEVKAAVMCVVIAILALISATVALALEFTHDNTLVHPFSFSWSYDDYCSGSNCVECAYIRIAACFLVLAGIVLCVFIAQIIIITLADRSCCFGVHIPSALQALAISAFFFSWLACIAAIIVYLIGGAKQYGAQSPTFGHLFLYMSSLSFDGEICYKVKHGISAAAAALSIAGVTIGIISYLALVLGDCIREKNSNQGLH